ncbi:hypothetical protein B0J17DRAFT_717046 [Rhizoctonia solani]|nr:hypothetical protein B0J17DRAFT_717046 [Rhizoctonia solani]
MKVLRAINARRRATVPQYHESERKNPLPQPTTPAKIPSTSNSSLPFAHRRSLKRLRKYYLSNLSSKRGSTQNQLITSGAYYRLEDTDCIHLETYENIGGTLGTLLLESPRPNKGPSMPQLLRRLSQSNAIKSIGNMVPVAPNLGYFSGSCHEASNAQTHKLLPTNPLETITYQTPLPLDNIVVLAGRISSRRSRRSLDSKPRSWFIEAMWEGLNRLKAVHENGLFLDPGTSSKGDNTPADISALVDGVMPTFGPSLLHFHHRVLKIQQKRDHTMSASQEQKSIVRQEIAERNQDILKTQAGWRAAEQEREELRRRESLLQKRVQARSPTVY